MPSTKYYFSVSCALKTQVIGELADGLRYHIEYDNSPGSVTTDAARYEQAWLAGQADSVHVTAIQGALPTAPKDERAGFAAALAAQNPAPAVARLYGQASLDTDLRSTALTAIRRTTITARPPQGLPGAGWLGIEGKVLSGADLATVRKDGVAVFDARVTISAADGFIIQGIFWGTVDFGAGSFANFSAAGNGLDGQKRVKLAARFEAAQVPPEYAARRYKTQAIGAWKYQELTRHQFVALGEIRCPNKAYYPADRIDLDVYSLEA